MATIKTVFMRLGSLLNQRVWEPLRRLLRTGVSPQAIATSAAIGSIIGIFPVLGTTTLLCTVLALSLKLNLVAMQSFNWLMAGPQLLLIVPLMRVGAALAGAPPPPFSAAEIRQLFDTGLGSALATLGLSVVHAVLGWLIVAPLGFALVYVTVLLCMRTTSMATRPTASV